MATLVAQGRRGAPAPRRRRLMWTPEPAAVASIGVSSTDASAARARISTVRSTAVQAHETRSTPDDRRRSTRRGRGRVARHGCAGPILSSFRRYALRARMPTCQKMSHPSRPNTPSAHYLSCMTDRSAAASKITTPDEPTGDLRHVAAPGRLWARLCARRPSSHRHNLPMHVTWTHRQRSPAPPDARIDAVAPT
jgi:hypothetical protein